jgi:BlaI family transcriptional regulator, penicillinase repressor
MSTISYKTTRLAALASSGTRLVERLMKNRELPSVTAAELRVLEALWPRGEATIGDLRDLLYPQGGESKFATVQKLLARLVAKGLVRRRKDAANWMFQPAAGRDELIGGELRRVADRLSAASMTPLLTYLVETGELNAKERAHLRRLLDEPPAAKRSPRTRKS